MPLTQIFLTAHFTALVQAIRNNNKLKYSLPMSFETGMYVAPLSTKICRKQKHLFNDSFCRILFVYIGVNCFYKTEVEYIHCA